MMGAAVLKVTRPVEQLSQGAQKGRCKTDGPVQELNALEEAFNAIPRDTIEAKSAFLDSEPWTPPAPEEEKDEDAPPF